MSEWIEELEKNAKEWSKNECLEGSVYNEIDPNISYFFWKEKEMDPGEIYLRGVFTLEQLTDLVNHMKKYKEKQC